jgi:hypothetical protein
VLHSPAKIVFEVSNVHEAVKEFAAHGLKFGKVDKWNGIAVADPKDPDGNPSRFPAEVSHPVPPERRTDPMDCGWRSQNRTNTIRLVVQLSVVCCWSGLSIRDPS